MKLTSTPSTEDPSYRRDDKGHSLGVKELPITHFT